jgi:transposase
VAAKPSVERTVRDIRRATRKHHSAEDKIRIVLEGLRGEDSIAALCRREVIAESLYYAWQQEPLEAGKRRLAGDTARAAAFRFRFEAAHFGAKRDVIARREWAHPALPLLQTGEYARSAGALHGVEGRSPGGLPATASRRN